VGTRNAPIASKALATMEKQAICMLDVKKLDATLMMPRTSTLDDDGLYRS
jgi:hypothetical protein